MNLFQELDSYPCLMNQRQRLVLFSLFVGLMPKRYLEIGSAKGGSALIYKLSTEFTSSDDYRFCLVYPRIDRIESETRESLGENVKYINETLNSSSILRALEFLEYFDVVLIDALHSLEMCRFDIFTVYPYIKPGGYILLDDSNYFEVKSAIKDSINSLNLIDCGLISAHGGIPKIKKEILMIDGQMSK